MFRDWKVLWALCAAAALWGDGARVQAQQSEPPTDRERLEKLEKQLELLQKQNEQLLRQLQTRPAGDSPVGTTVDKDEVRNLVSEFLNAQAEQKKAEGGAMGSGDGKGGEKAKTPLSEWFAVGSDFKMSATWKNGFVVSTTRDDFSLHVGGWVQYDNVFWTQSPALLKAQGGFAGPKQGVASGARLGGIGDLEDGTFFRRERIQLDGKVWENYEYNFVFALENDTFNTNGLDEFWVGATNIPIIGTARVGHVKNCIGLEADMTGSSKTMTFLERSSYSEAVELNQNFVTGLWLGNNYFDQRATWSGVIFRPDPGASTGAFFGDGQWGWQGRLTALPLYENDGRCLLHLGLSGGWRNGASFNALTPNRLFLLRARPELRDDDPAGAFSGAQAANGNSARLVDTGVIEAQREWLMGLEALYIRGPFSVQAEYGWNWVEGVSAFNPSAGAPPPPVGTPAFIPKTQQDYMFNGGYIQLAYTLTGENRSYDKRLGRLDTYYFGRKGPFTPAWFVRDEDGRLNWGLGAWELAARYSYVNLNDGTGVNRVQGGKMDGFTVGLNWYLNDNLKFQFDWVYDHRYDLPAGGGAISIPGYTSGLGMRVQFMY